MADNKDNSKKSESPKEDNTQPSQKSTTKKRFKFKKEDMYEMTYNF